MNNQPAKIDDLVIFRENPCPVQIEFDSIDLIISPVLVELWASGVFFEEIPHEIIGTTISFTTTPEQHREVKKASIYIKMDGIMGYWFPVTITMDGSVAEPRVRTITAPSIGKIRVSTYSDIAAVQLAEQYAANAKASEEAAASYSNGVGVAEPDSFPIGQIKIYNVSLPGTYVNFAGVVITSEDFGNGIVQIRQINGAWQKFIVEMPLDSYAKKDVVDSFTNQTGGVTIDISLPTANGFLLTNGTLSASASWRASQMRPVEENDVVTYYGVCPIVSTGNPATMVGFDANGLNPVVLIPASVGVQPPLTQQVTITGDVIKLISACYRFTGGDTFSLTKATPPDVYVKKEKVVGLLAMESNLAALDEDFDEIAATEVTDYAQTMYTSGYIDTSGNFTSSASWRAVLNLATDEGEVFHYTGNRPNQSSGSTPVFAAVIGYDANHQNPVVLLSRTTTGFVVYDGDIVTPAGVKIIEACARYTGSDTFNFTRTQKRVKVAAIPGGDMLPFLSQTKNAFMPPFTYGKRNDELRIYPAGIVALNQKDRSTDFVWNTNLSNEEFASFVPATGNANIPITLKQRLSNGQLKVVGTTTVRITHTTQSPATAKNVLFVGDSLIYGQSAELTPGGAVFEGAIANEFSRRLTGVGTPLIAPGPAALGLTNIYVRGTLGNQPVKHEGRAGWGIDTYMYEASRSGVANKFYNAALSGTNKFDLLYYLTQNNFLAAQTAGGVDATGSNLVIYILLGWNHVYTTNVTQAGTWLALLLDTIIASHPAVTIKLLGLNTPPPKIYKSNYLINTRDVSSESIMRDIIAYSNKWQEVATAPTRSARTEFVPVAHVFNPDGSYQTVSKASGLRGGAVSDFATDYVHPWNPGYAYYSDAAYYNFLYHYCRAS